MDGFCEMMDDFCIWVEKVLLWVDRDGPPPIPWIGQAGGRLYNPPAPHVEFIYLKQGQMDEVRIGDRPVILPQGHLSIHNVHVGNIAPSPRTANLAWCCFLDVGGVPEFDSLKREPLFGCVPVTDGQRLEQAFADLQTRCAVALGPPGGYLGGAYAYAPDRAESLTTAQRMGIKSACVNLLAAMLREGEHRREGVGVRPDAVRRAMAYISLHSRESGLRLEQVAGHAGLSMDHFGRVFRAALRTSPMQYLQAVRVEHSRFLLQHTRLTIAEIAGETGFTDPYYFSRVFRKVTGTSPRAYRRRG